MALSSLRVRTEAILAGLPTLHDLGCGTKRITRELGVTRIRVERYVAALTVPGARALIYRTPLEVRKGTPRKH